MKVVHLICAARPNFMKVAPLYHALAKTDWCTPVIVWVRQHTDAKMANDFFHQLNLPAAPCFESYESALQFLQRPAAAIVPGDVNAAVDSAIAAARRGIPVVHLEAGLRSFDRSMPEEINRVVMDVVSDVLLTPSLDAVANLANEGIRGERGEKVEFVGNIMIDAFEMLRPQIEAVPKREGPYAVVTLHRPSNVDDPDKLAELIQQIRRLSDEIDVVIPVHPRMRKRMFEFDFYLPKKIDERDPMPYVEFMALVKGATIVITDSGGVQEETSYLGVPCATVRENTERPITISHGTNELIQPSYITTAAHIALKGAWKKGGPIPLWDGKTADRCVAALKNFLAPQRGDV